MNSPQIDTLIIGAGPAGLSVAKDLKERGITPVIVEKGPIGAHIYEYPTFMTFHSTRENVSLGGLPLTIPEEKPSRQQYCRYLADFVRHFSLDVRTYTELTGLRKSGDHFEAVIRTARGEERWRARTVVAAVGAWEHPRRLTCPGADLPKVRYRFYDPHEYVGARVLVVGGRNSALENGLAIFRAGGEVSICHRGPDFSGKGTKYWLAPDMENRIRAGEIRGFLNSSVSEIRQDEVDIQTPEGLVTLANDFVLPQLGYHPPVEFLRRIGLQVEDEESRPVHDPQTFESHIPGLFVAGVIAAGDVSGHIFIENARDHGKFIAPRIAEILELVTK